MRGAGHFFREVARRKGDPHFDEEFTRVAGWVALFLLAMMVAFMTLYWIPSPTDRRPSQESPPEELEIAPEAFDPKPRRLREHADPVPSIPAPAGLERT
jgi:hypothetical protein